MPDKITKKHKHLTYDQREEIQGCLNHGVTFKAIGQRIGKDQTAVSKEVKRHLVSQPLEHRAFDSQGNPLLLEPCSKHLKAPFCCNPCEKKHRQCAFPKRFYYAKPAQKA
jgi:IS30 family transposase